MQNKLWTKPELVVLDRSKPEERVLSACKTSSTFIGYNSNHNGCYFGAAMACFDCDTVAAS